MSDSPHHEAAADSSLLAQQQHNSTGADDASSTTSAAETPTAAVKVQKPKAAAPAAAHNNGGVVVTLADLGLDNLGDDKTIRALLDPSSNAVNPLSGFDWSEAKLERLVEVLKPEHLAVLIKKRSQTQLEESAKTLSWHHLTYTTASGVKLLDDVSGYILPGMLVGLLGAPDSGITPLLQVLAGEHPHHGSLTGEVLYDGQTPDTSFKRQVGFAVKQDTHLSHLTVFESLFFSARLRLPDGIPDRIVRYRVKMAMKLLGISHTANTPVGDAILRGISGGEKRRLGFGLEMVAGHSIILADLPTNGLDSATAFGLIRTMAFACRGGFSLMASLVQPSLELFLLLDRVMLLSKGRTIYFGPPGAAEAFFRGHGFHRPPNKSVPQFLEELSAKPEQFWQADDMGVFGGNNSSNNSLAASTFYQAPAQQLEAEQQREDAAAATEAPRKTAWKFLSQRFSEDSVNKHIMKELEHIREQKENHVPHGLETVGGFGINEHQQQQQQQQGATYANITTDSSDSSSLPEFDAHTAAAGEALNHDDSSSNNRDEREDAEFHSVAVALDKEVIRPVPAGKQLSPLSSTPTSDKASAATATATLVTDSSHLRGPLKHWYAKYNSGPYSQFKWNLWRQVILTIRNVGLWRDIWLISMSMGFIIGSLFYQLPTTETGIHNRVGEFFYILSYIGFNAVQLVPVLHEQREVYYSQIERGYYQTFGYYFSLLLVQVPIVIVDTLLLLLPIWGLSALNGAPFISGNFWYAYLIVGMNSLVSRVWMFLLYAASPNEVYADVLNQVTNILFTKLCGYFIAANSIVGGWKWMYDISYFTYGLLGLAVSDVCSTVNADSRGVLCVPSPENTCRFQTGSQGLALLYDMDCSINRWYYFADLIYFFLTFNLAGYMAFYVIDWSQHDVPEFPNFGEQEVTEDSSSDIDAAAAFGGGAIDIRTEQPAGNTMTRQQQQRTLEQQQVDANSSSWRRLAAPQIPISKKRSDIVVDEDFAAVTGLAVPATIAALPADASAADIDAHQLSLSRNSNNSMTNSQSMHYSHRVRIRAATEATSTGTATAAHARGATCEWYNLDYDVPVKSESGSTIQRRLLNKVYGFCVPGMMVALMGATGAGKTTLLDVLAGKKTGGKIMGTLLINGKPRGNDFSHIAGYVEQFDSHNPFSTIREAIELSGRLRLPPTTTDAEVQKKLESVLDVLGIRHLQHEMIGGPGLGGVSQEIRKKVTIGVELIMEPQLLFLDEPTTGLDSAGAFAVMVAVRNLAKSISVICTIHQPAAEIVGMFDWLLLLRPGGHVVYFSPMKDLPAYFKDHDIGECPAEKNIADFALERVKAVDSSYTQKMEKSAAVVVEDLEDETIVINADGTKDLAREFKFSREGKLSLDRLRAGIAPRAADLDITAVSDDTRAGPRTNFMVQFKQLNKRFYLNTIRNRQTLGVRFFLTVFFGFLVGTVFFQQSFDNRSADQRVSAVFVTLLFVMFTANAFLPDIFSARPMYFREVMSDMYSAGPFYCARYVADVPFVILENLILALMADYIATLGTNPAPPFFGWFFLALIAARYASITCTYAIGTIIELANNANTIHATYFNLLFAFSGFLIPGPSIPVWWQWFYDLDFLRWALHFIAADMERGQSYYCNPATDELVPVYLNTYNACPLTEQTFVPAYFGGAQKTPMIAAGQSLPMAANGYPGLLLDYTQGRALTGQTQQFTAVSSGSAYTASLLSNNNAHSIYNFDTVVGVNMQNNSPQPWLLKCNYACGVDLLNSYGVNYTDNWLAIELCVVWGFALFFGVIGYYALKKINHVNR